MKLFTLISATIFLVPSVSLLSAFGLPNNYTFTRWNEILEKKLYDLTSYATQIDFAREIYLSDRSVSIEKVKGEDLLNSVLIKIDQNFRNKKVSLKKLVNAAEAKYSHFQKNHKSILTLEDLSVFNVKAINPAVKMVYSSHFRQPVSYQESGVHIPLEIFDGWMGPRYKEAWWHDPEILNGLNWTAPLDDIFKENLKNDVTLRWQYFGSFYGFLRVYPAFRWPDQPSLPDLFDVRRRSWYIQGSVTPKDVIILFDRSGSVHGPTLDMMKITAKALINSLGENDYLNVAWFNNKVRWIVPCLNSLVQATSQIKRLFGDAVEQLTESNFTNYAVALDFAFNEFKKFEKNKKPWMGSNCHKLIMFISDGGTEWPTDLVTKHCNESRNGHIKIFTFACGPHPIPTVVLKEMACATGGYFSAIAALGSVRVKIRDYVKVLSRPLAYSKDSDLYQWSNFYRDIGGLGMVTSLTLPVFNTNPENLQENLLGVMGIDIPIEEIVKLFPKHILGAFGYPFAINTNGFVIFHPRLYDHIIYIQDPPNLYLTDLEGNTEELEEMEKQIVKGLKGSLKGYQSIVPVGLGQAILTEVDYFYGPVDSSTFRFGIVLPSKCSEIKIKKSNAEFFLPHLTALGKTAIAPWKFCLYEDTFEDLTIEKLVDLITYNYSSCNEDLINHLLWDAEKVLKIKNYWSERLFPEVESRFVMTSGGLTTAQSSILLETDQKQIDPFQNNLYKRASSTQGFVFSLGEKNWNILTVAGRIILPDDYVSAVVGAEINQKIVQQIFDETVGFEEVLNCNSSELLHCYLLNDGGIITATNVENFRVGNFLGVHDSELLEALLKKGILNREYRYNYKSWCSKDFQQTQAKASNNFVSVFEVLLKALISFQWNFLYTTLLYFISRISEGKKIENYEPTLEFANYSCVTRSAFYYHSGMLESSGTLNCGFYSRSFQIKFLKKVSLFFLVAEPFCNNSNYMKAITLNPIEDLENHHCSKREHYRIRPNKCYSQMPKVPLDCGNTSNSPLMKMNLMTMYNLVFLLLLSYFWIFETK